MLVAQQDNGRSCAFATERESQSREAVCVRTWPMRYQRCGLKDAAVRMTCGKLVAARSEPSRWMSRPWLEIPCSASDHHLYAGTREPRDGRGLVPELRGLLRHRHPRDEVVDASVDGQPRVAERDVGRRDGAAIQLQQDHQRGGDVEEGEERAAFHGFDGFSVGTERSEAREGRREVRGERRGKGEIEAAAAGREARERAAA
jgi:hypothetical protein